METTKQHKSLPDPVLCSASYGLVITFGHFTLWYSYLRAVMSAL